MIARAALLVAALVATAGLRADDRLYWYRCDNVRVSDGDTIECQPLQLGMGLSKDWMIRLHEINAPEVTGPQKPAGLRSKHWLASRIEGRDVIIRTEKDESGKFGRLIATVYDDELDLNREMVRLGLAEHRVY